MSRPRSPDPDPIVVPAKPKARIKAMIQHRLGDKTAFYDTATKKWKYPVGDIVKTLRKLEEKYRGEIVMIPPEQKLYKEFFQSKSPEN